MNQTEQKKILCLCGGVGGAKLALGFSQLLNPDNLTIVVNTGDDFEHLGFTICPDIDTVIYTLSGRSNKTLGWGLEGETWQFMEELKKRGGEDWFLLGDKDLETHKKRLLLLTDGNDLTAITAQLASDSGIEQRILPMSNDPVRTIIRSSDPLFGDLAFQHYFVREKCEPPVSGFYFHGAEQATANPAFVQALEDPALSAIVICPSNPFVSIDPILSLPGIREKLQQTKVPVIAVSPIIGGQAVKGPTAKMMDELKIPKTSAAIAEHYQGLIDTLILDNTDSDQQQSVTALGIEALVTQTLMKSDADKQALAKFVLDSL